MRAGNILTFIAVLLWGGLALLGHELSKGVYAQRVLGYPSLGQFDWYVVFPFIMLTALLLSAWLCNTFRRWSWLLRLAGILALVVLIPYLFAYTGGV
jgi:hypothetical protein